MTTIEFTIPGVAVPKARARVVKRGNFVHSYTPEKTASWESYCRFHASEHAPEELLDCPLSMTLLFVLPKPKSAPKKSILPAKKPDIENLSKSILDALEGVIFTNDSRVCDLTSKKRYGDPPRVEIRIEEIRETSG